MLMRTDPFREFDRFFDGGLASGPSALMGMDAHREDDRLIARFDLPGVDPNSIDITVEKNQLTVRAQQSWEPAEDVQVIASERPQGTFTRSLFLGEGLDVDHIAADYDHSGTWSRSSCLGTRRLGIRCPVEPARVARRYSGQE